MYMYVRSTHHARTPHARTRVPRVRRAVAGHRQRDDPHAAREDGGRLRPVLAAVAARARAWRQGVDVRFAEDGERALDLVAQLAVEALQAQVEAEGGVAALLEEGKARRGVYKTKGGFEVNTQVAEVYFDKRRLQPVPEEVARDTPARGTAARAAAPAPRSRSPPGR